jgi:hypothetical protein
MASESATDNDLLPDYSSYYEASSSEQLEQGVEEFQKNKTVRSGFINEPQIVLILL